MQKKFLEVNADIKSNKLTNIVGLWLLTGDEPLVQDWFIDTVRPLFTANHQIIQRLDLTSPKQWQAVLGELSSLSLFGDNTALIVNGKQKCDDKVLLELENFAKSTNTGDVGHCLIYQLPKQDKKEQNAKLYQLFAKNGVIVDCHLYNEKDRRQLLAVKADEFGLNLTNGAWDWLIAQTENNLIAGFQALWRASDLYANDPKTLDIDELMPVMVANYQYSVYELADQFLLGNAQKVLHILNHLRHTDTAPSVILWALNKEIRTVLQLNSGKSMSELGIWQSKMGLYQTALRRAFNPNLLNLTYQTDQAIKGLSNDNAWDCLQKVCLLGCGVTVFAN